MVRIVDAIISLNLNEFLISKLKINENTRRRKMEGTSNKSQSILKTSELILLLIKKLTTTVNMLVSIKIKYDLLMLGFLIMTIKAREINITIIKRFSYWRTRSN